MHALDRVLITGAAGFVGSTLAKSLLSSTESFVVGLDTLAEPRNPSTVDGAMQHQRFRLLVGDISDTALIVRILREYNISAVVNCAAETSIDRSIGDPLSFVSRNVMGTSRLVDAVAEYWDALPQADRQSFRFVQSSTIDVYGSAEAGGRFTDQTACAPNSPYAASMAAADMVVRAYWRTYGLPTIIARSSTNYGPFQSAERLVPRTTYNAVHLRKQFVYGDGQHMRDWIHIDDQCRGIRRILERGEAGRIYHLSTGLVRSNLDVVRTVCRIVDEYRPAPTARESYIQFVADRPGHDRHHATAPDETDRDLGWSAEIPFDRGLRDVVLWHIEQIERQNRQPQSGDAGTHVSPSMASSSAS